jgi:hypothetical protein
MKKVACTFFNISNDEFKNYDNDTFFAPNAINSFKKFHPDVEVHYITDENWKDYLSELSISEYFDNIGLVRIHIIKELMKVRGYDKVIMLGIDTFTCSRLDEFLDNDTPDMICSSGPPYRMSTQYWTPPVINTELEGKVYEDVAFINADVTCFNNAKAAEVLYETSVKYWTEHAEQGGMNYCFSNQQEVGISVGLVDFPYITTKVLYNVRSKGKAHGGSQMVRGKLLEGKGGVVTGDVYPTSEYYVDNNRLFTKDHKQIKVFHYAESLITRPKVGTEYELSYDEQLNEIKTMWFNKETIDFLENVCDCKF